MFARCSFPLAVVCPADNPASASRSLAMICSGL